MMRKTKHIKLLLNLSVSFTGRGGRLFMLLIFLLSGSTVMAQTDTEFWFVAPEVTAGHGAAGGYRGGEPIYLKITTQALPATVRVNQPANVFHPALNPDGFPEIIVDIPENTVHVIDLTPWIDIIENNWWDVEPLNNFGLHITATNMITAYYEVGTPNNPDIFSLKGKNALGTEFYTPFQTFYDNPNQYSPRPYSAIDIVATMDNTEIKITTRKASTLGPAGTYTIYLDRGQTYSVSPAGFNRLKHNRLDGTRITSNNPIAVTIKDDSVAANPYGGCRDLIGDQLIPTNIIGTEYIVMKGRLGIPEHAYVLATRNGTDVYINDVYITTIDEGETYRHEVPDGTSSLHVRTTEPSYLLHVAGFGCEMGGAILPPVNVCTGSTQVGFTRSKAESFFLNILVRTGAEDGFLFNGAPHPMLNAGIFEPVPGTDQWLAADIGSIGTGTIPVGAATMISNTKDVFHLGIINGGATTGTMYGYFSDFNELEVRAIVAGTTSNVLRTCFGIPVRLFASGGTNYKWEPHDYLDDPFSATPWANPLTSTLYRVSVSGACNMTDTATISVQVSTPLEAMFTFDQGSVCAPEQVTFYNKSIGGVNFRWYIDKMLVDMSMAKEDITYTFENNTDDPIQHTIELWIRNADGCSDQIQRTITVYPAIKSEFEASPAEGCDPLAVEFNNISSGNTDKWYWDFGDGASSVIDEPAHVFLNRSDPDNATYPVSLVAISPFQCRDTSTLDITVSPYIEAGFTFDQPTGCAPWELQIHNQSIGADNYYWDFGDGNTSVTSQGEFIHIFDNEGINSVAHTIQLRVTNDEGCEDMIEREVTVHPEISAGFTAEPEDGCSPHHVNFTNLSTGASLYYWEFGDGASSEEADPEHTYPVNLTNEDIVYSAMLVAVSDQGCTDTAVVDITVHPWIEASFTIDNIEGCHPLTLTINNNSIGADHYRWNFGDGSDIAGSSAPVLIHTYYNTGSSDTVYEMKLVVENDQGCKDSLTREVIVWPEITASFQPDPMEGCEPLIVKFNDMSKNAVKWYWDFDDGTGSDQASPSHTFINTGTGDIVRRVSLTTLSENGQCTATDTMNIRVHGRVVADFTIDGDTGCNPFDLDFINNSSGASNFLWDFGDGNLLQTGSTGIVSHSFINSSFTSMENFEVSLIARNYAGCSSEITKTVNVYPDIRAGFSASATEGCHPLSIDFLKETEGGYRFYWDFGDGSSSTEASPQHTFTNTGTVDSIYRVMLLTTAANNVCKDSFFIDIVVHPYVKADFNLSGNADCNPFYAGIENNSVHASVFYWDFGDGTDSITYNMDPFVKIFNNSSFNSPVNYRVNMRAENYAGCSSETSRTLTVHPDILAGFEVSAAEGCHPLTVDFLNNIQGSAYYSWDFGDGNSSSLESPTHVFTNTGTEDSVYRVRLVATAANNVCTDTFYMDIKVHPYVNAVFSFPESISCTPFEVEFSNTSVGAEKYTWDFGDGSNTVKYSKEPFTHTFFNPGYENRSVYLVSMTAESYAGCTDQTEKAVTVYHDIEALFEASVTEGCHPLNVDFENLTRGGSRFEWDFGNGITSTSHSPTHTFTNKGSNSLTRQVVLRSFSGDYCTSEYSMDITIHPNPRARFEIDNTATCPPFDLPIVNTSIDADQFTWIFGDGSVSKTRSGEIFYHTYDNPEEVTKTYNLRLIAQSDFGCTDSTEQHVYVYPRVNADFSSVTEGCSPLQVRFQNHTTGAHNFTWDFGDGMGIGIKEPEHVYFNNSFNDTSYFVQLAGISEFGCTDTAGYRINVYPQPVAEFSVTPMFQEYPSVRVDLENASKEGIWQYLWNFDDGNTSRLKDPMSYEFGDWGEYNIRLRVWNDQCADSASHRIFIQPPAPVASFAPPDPGCVPHTIRFRNTSVYGHSYYWDFDDGNISREIEPAHTYTEFGVYNVKLIVTGEGGENYTYRQVEVYRKPVVDFNVVPETVLLPHEEVQLYNMSEYGVRYEWYFGDGNYSSEKDPSHLYTEIGVYDISLAVWTEHNCTDDMYLEQVVTVTGSGEIIFPNAFIPNPSGPSGGYYDPNDPTSNTIFRPYWDGVTEYRLRIYNRWGEFLFESKDIMQGWDGYYQGKLSKQDVYVWKVWVTFTNGKSLVTAGDVTLLR